MSLRVSEVQDRSPEGSIGCAYGSSAPDQNHREGVARSARLDGINPRASSSASRVVAWRPVLVSRSCAARDESRTAARRTRDSSPPNRPDRWAGLSRARRRSRPSGRRRIDRGGRAPVPLSLGRPRPAAYSASSALSQPRRQAAQTVAVLSQLALATATAISAGRLPRGAPGPAMPPGSVRLPARRSHELMPASHARATTNAGRDVRAEAPAHRETRTDRTVLPDRRRRRRSGLIAPKTELGIVANTIVTRRALTPDQRSRPHAPAGSLDAPATRRAMARKRERGRTGFPRSPDRSTTASRDGSRFHRAPRSARARPPYPGR